MELRRVELELQVERVALGVKEQEFLILQKLADIERIKKSIEVSKAKIEDLKKQLAEFGG